MIKSILGITDTSQDALLYFYLDCAEEIICDIRNSQTVETKYLKLQIKIALELYSKGGAEGQIAHTENGISRTYESSDISPSLLNQITPFVKTPFSTVRSNI